MTCATAGAAVSKPCDRGVCHILLTSVRRSTVDVSLRPNGILCKEKWEKCGTILLVVLSWTGNRVSSGGGACALPGQIFLIVVKTATNLSTSSETFQAPLDITFYETKSTAIPEPLRHPFIPIVRNVQLSRKVSPVQET